MSTTRRVWFFSAALVFGLVGSFVVAPGGEGRGGVGGVLSGDSKKSVEAADVYVGDAKKWDKPAEVDAKDPKSPRWVYKNKTFDPDNNNQVDPEITLIFQKDSAGKLKVSQVIF